MILKNLFRQKGRTILTIISIAIGVAAIVGLSALADGLQAGYDSILSGSNADLILTKIRKLQIEIVQSADKLGRLEKQLRAALKAQP